MILVDTSVWIDHFRTPELALARLMADEAALMHPLVLGELCMGDLRPRAETIRLLTQLPQASEARHLEVREVIEREQLFSSGLSFIDAHLLASALLDRRQAIWTRDRRLSRAMFNLGVAAFG